MPKKRAFVRYTKSGEIVPGSLIITTNGGYPDKSSLWKEVTVDQCCDGGGEGGCNNCEPGTITLVSNIPVEDLEYPSFLGVELNFGINGVSCPDAFVEVGTITFTAFGNLPVGSLNLITTPQDVITVINNSEVAKNNNIIASIINIPEQGERFQIIVDKCSCLGVYLNGGVSLFNITLVTPALPNPNN